MIRQDNVRHDNVNKKWLNYYKVKTHDYFLMIMSRKANFLQDKFKVFVICIRMLLAERMHNIHATFHKRRSMRPFIYLLSVLGWLINVLSEFCKYNLVMNRILFSKMIQYDYSRKFSKKYKITYYVHRNTERKKVKWIQEGGNKKCLMQVNLQI